MPIQCINLSILQNVVNCPFLRAHHIKSPITDQQKLMYTIPKSLSSINIERTLQAQFVALFECEE